LAERAFSLSNDVAHLDTLAAAFAETGDFTAAVRAQRRAIGLLRRNGKNGELADFQTRLNLYRQEKPYRR
jgi:hypothetical protein